jgi:hypothetical protein
MPRPERDRPLIAQGGYYVATGVAPFVSRRLFERVTGPKADWWLVQTVGVLVTAAGAGMVSTGRSRRHRRRPRGARPHLAGLPRRRGDPGRRAGRRVSPPVPRVIGRQLCDCL